MKRPDIAKRLARESGISRAEAADRLDRMVDRILSRLREGKSAPLPGLGRFTAGAGGVVSFEPRKGGRRG